MVYAKLTELLSAYKRLFLGDLATSSIPHDSKLNLLMAEFIQKLWPLCMQITSSQGSVFSYESTANFYFEMCSFYSFLFYNPKSLVNNTAKEMKLLLDMIENIAFPSATSSSDEAYSQLVVVRLKFLNNLLRDENLLEICQKNLANTFEVKLLNFFISTYLNNVNIHLLASGPPGSNNDPTTNSTTSTNQSVVEKEFFLFLNQLTLKLNVLQDLNMTNQFNNSSESSAKI